MIPEVAELELAEAAPGLRPGSPDNAPLIGPFPADPTVVIATGHHRNGILLAPVTGDAVAAMLAGEELRQRGSSASARIASPIRVRRRRGVR